MEEPSLFSLPKEIFAIIINLVGTEHLLKSESISKQWQKLLWDSHHTLDICSKQKSEFNDEKFSQLLKKANPLKVRKIIFSGDKTLSANSLTQLAPYNNLIAFSCRSLALSAIQAIIPVLTSVRRLDLSSRDLSDHCITLFAQHMPLLTKLFVGNSSELRDLPGITRLTKLETLNLAFSDKVADQGMHEICQMTNLKKLDICWLRNITGEGFEKISKLTKLIHLDISNINGVPDTYLTALLALTNLELLDTSYYKILTDFGISIIGKLTNLKRLVLVDHRKVTSSGMNYLTNLTNLKHLSLSAMSHISNDHYFSSLINLTFLSVKMNEQNFSVLTNLKGMQDLNISALSNINEEFFRCTSAMTGLAKLTLRTSRCSVVVDTLTSCTNLTCLELDDCMSFYAPENSMDDDIIERLLQLTTLKGLGIRFNRGFNRLATMTNLETLVLQATPHSKVRNEDFAELLTLPNLESLNLTSPLPDKELREMFSANSKLTHLVIETNNQDVDDGELL
jgi:hypothetical protein